MSKQSPYIDVSDLRISYPLNTGLPFGGRGGRQYFDAISNLSFRLEKGDRLGLLGRNGSGKSTLLKALAGIYAPNRGRIDIRGDVASIFNASLGFIQDATGYENIYIRGTLLGLSYSEIEEKVNYITEFSELGDWLSRPVSTYSSGMALRLAFAITTSVECEILLLDEWLGAGDADFIGKARARMRQLVERTGILVLATHNLSLLSAVCNKVAVMEGGRFVAYGPADEVVPEYQKRLRASRKALGA